MTSTNSHGVAPKQEPPQAATSPEREGRVLSAGNIAFVIVPLAVLCLLCYLDHNWEAYARVSLLSHGVFACDIVSPDASLGLPVGFPGGFDGQKLVYVDGRYAGYLNKYGEFVRPSTRQADVERGWARKWTILVVIKACCVVFVVLSLLRVIVRLAFAKARSFGSDGKTDSQG